MLWEGAAAALVFAVILVNGWTDAPNAIAACVATGALPMKKAVALAAAGNLAGVWVSVRLGGRVTRTVLELAAFGEGPRALAGLCAGMGAVVLWAVGAWRWGIPTSESHALTGGLAGAAVALGGFSALRPGPWLVVLAGTAGSLAAGGLGGWGAARLLDRCFPKGRRGEKAFFRRSQIAGAAAMAFLHGAQDGQKFLGVLLLAGSHGGGRPPDSPLPVVLCALLMALGTAMGGGRIVRTVGQQMVRLDGKQGFAADLAGILCLGVSTGLGAPVSTTHAKTAAILGAAAAGGGERVNWRIAGEMVLAWVLTLPGCALLGWLLARWLAAPL